jgi:hypothetical protein
MSMQSRLKLPLIIPLLSAFLLTIGGASADAADCRPIYVVGNAREIVDCPTDQKFDFCLVRSSVVDRAGLLTGRLEYFEDSSQGSKHPHDPSISLYVGVDKITTEKGVVELAERGLFDADSSEYAGLAKITSATGELTGYTGTIADTGNTKGTLLITGTICKQ